MQVFYKYMICFMPYRIVFYPLPRYNFIMIKISVIGASSLYFSHKFLVDLLTMNLNSHCILTLMSPRISQLYKYEIFVSRLIADNNLDFSVNITADLESAIEGSDFVVSFFAIGSMKCMAQDYNVPLKYGVDQCIGDTMGPGGIFRSQRVLPIIEDMIDKMKRLCPEAYLINYVNPLSVTMMAIERLGFKKSIGICGGIETTKDFIAFVLDEKKQDLTIPFAGINHLSIAVKIEKNGIDLYPEFKKRLKDPGFLSNEKTRFDVMQHYGYFMTESSGHLSDMVPWYRKSSKDIAKYCNASGFHGASGAYYKFSNFLSNSIGDVDFLQFVASDGLQRSDDYGVGIIEAMVVKGNFDFYGNVVNTQNFIKNLPKNCAVEIPMKIVDGEVVQNYHDHIPVAISALLKTNIIIHELCIEAYFQKDPNLLVNALALDPLTSSVLAPHECHLLAGEMLEIQKKYFPQFIGKSLATPIEIKKHYKIEPYEIPNEFDISELIKYKRKLRILEKNKKS
jgi:alpha-galactosidase